MISQSDPDMRLPGVALTRLLSQYVRKFTKMKRRNKTVWSSAPLKMHPAPFPSFLQLLSLPWALLPPLPSTPPSLIRIAFFLFFFFKSPWPESWGPGGFGGPSRMRSKLAGGERAWDERGNEKEERLSSQNSRKGKQKRGMRTEETVRWIKKKNVKIKKKCFFCYLDKIKAV